MLDDGEKLVPGFRQARALRVWTGRAPAVRGRQGGRTPTRATSRRAHALLDHARARRRGRLRHDHRRQADDVPADGRGHGRRGLRAARRAAAVHDRRPSRCPAPRTSERYQLGERLRAQGDAPRRRAADLRVRAGRRAASSRRRCAARATTNLDDIRRLLRLGMGPCQGGFCIYRATGILHGARRARAPSRPTSRCSTSSRSAGRACGRSSTATSCARRGSTTGSSRACSTWSTCRAMRRRELHYDAVVIGAGTAGLVAGDAPGRGRRARVRAGQGRRRRRIWRRRRSTCSATRPSASTRPRAALERARRQRPDHPYALLGAEAVATRCAGSRERRRRAAARLRYGGSSSATCCCPPPSARCARRRSCPETMADGDASARRAASASSARARCATSTPALCAANLDAGRASRPRGGRASSSSPIGAPTRTRSGWRARFDDPDVARGVRRRLRARRCAPTSASGCRRCSGSTRPARRAGATSSTGSAAACSRSRRCRRRFPGCGCPRSCAPRCARAGGRLVLGAEVVSSRARRRAGRPRSRPRLRPRRPLRGAVVRARRRRVASGGDRARLALGEPTRRVFGLPLRGVPAPGEPRFVADYLAEQPMARVGVAVTPTCAPRRAENVLVAGAALPGAAPWREASGEGISLASGYARRADDPRRRRCGGGMTAETTCRRPPARLARPLRQVHDLRDPLPGVQRDAAVPRAEYAGPQSERYRVADEPSVDASVDYCSGCGICSQVCPQGVKIAEINAQARDKLKRETACRCATGSSPARPGSAALARRRRRSRTSR